jgi:hypothetical protein
MSGEESADGGIVEFFAVVSLESMYRATELGGDIREKNMLGWRERRIYGEEEKSTQSLNNHPISQDSE